MSRARSSSITRPLLESRKAVAQGRALSGISECFGFRVAEATARHPMPLPKYLARCCGSSVEGLSTRSKHHPVSSHFRALPMCWLEVSQFRLTFAAEALRSDDCCALHAFANLGPCYRAHPTRGLAEDNGVQLRAAGVFFFISVVWCRLSRLRRLASSWSVA